MIIVTTIMSQDYDIMMIMMIMSATGTPGPAGRSASADVTSGSGRRAGAGRENHYNGEHGRDCCLDRACNSDDEP